MSKWWILGGLGAIAIGAMAASSEPSVDLSVFDSPDQPGSGKLINREFLKMLQELERRSGYPVLKNINSGVRTHAHNRKVGGVSNSSHLITDPRAADIRTPSRQVQKMLARVAVQVGFRRIGIGRTFIHLDNDPTKPQPVVWGYPSPAPFNPFL